MFKNTFIFLVCLGLFISCDNKPKQISTPLTELESDTNSKTDTLIQQMISQKMAQQKYWDEIKNLPDSSFVELVKLDSMFVLDIRYATTNNFTKTVLYPCAEAMLRKVVALQLVKVQQELIKKGYRLKIFDGYRPLSVQWKMWEVYPDRRYVADPKKGSWHNRGSAVDLTLCTLEGKQIEMGTPYDFFGKEAWPTYTDLPKDVLKHRKLLADTMWKFGFRPTSTEWWHYSYRPKNFAVSNHPLNCK